MHVEEEEMISSNQIKANTSGQEWDQHHLGQDNERAELTGFPFWLALSSYNES